MLQFMTKVSYKCTLSLVSTSPETKRDTQEEPYYDCIQVKDMTERDHSLAPVDTSINIAYGAAQDLGMCRI